MGEACNVNLFHVHLILVLFIPIRKQKAQQNPKKEKTANVGKSSTGEPSQEFPELNSNYFLKPYQKNIYFLKLRPNQPTLKLTSLRLLFTADNKGGVDP